jgi:DNA-directed RNA polymerase beta subunit
VDERDGLITNELNENSVRVNIPYAMKMMLQEVQTMGIGPRLVTNTDTTNEKIFDHILEGL